MNTEEVARKLMMQAIDKQNAWIHVGMTYAASVASEDYVKRNKKTGKMDRRDNRARLAYALNHAIGDVIDFQNIWKNKVLEKQSK